MQYRKKALMPYEHEGPGERAHMCSLIWTVSVHGHILQYLLIQKAGNKGPDQP